MQQKRIIENNKQHTTIIQQKGHARGETKLKSKIYT